MGCLSLVWSLAKVFLICAIITFIPGIPPHAEYKEYNVVRPKALDAELLKRKHLDKAERLFEGQLTGPEAFAFYNGAVYTGIHGGFVVQIDEGELRPLVKFGKHCEDITEEHICGRPLGMQFDAAGNLYVADAYYGVFKYNAQKAEKTLLVDSNQEIDGKKSMFINDLAVAKDGTVYFTVSSTTFPLHEGVHASLAPGDGRIIRYDPQSKKASVLAEGLLLPNGIALSMNEDFLVFSETLAARVMRLNLKGSNQGTVSVFAEGLPGLPDNIRVDGRGGFYASLVVLADDSHPALSVTLGPFPYIRKFLGRLLFLLEFPFAQINQAYPKYLCKRTAHFIGHFSGMSALSPEGVNILHLDSQGQIKDALVGRDGSINHISDMIVVGDYILLGSPYNNYIGRIPRPNEPYHVHVKSVRFEEATPEDKSRSEAAAKKAAAEEAEKARKASVEAAEKARKASEEAAEKARKASEEAARKAAEDAARKAAEEAARKAAEEAARKAAEEASRKAAAEAARVKREAEIAAQKASEEAKARRAAEEAKAKKAAQEAAKKAAEEARARKAAEENAQRAAKEAEAKKLAEDAKAKKIEDLKLKKFAEESAKVKAAEEVKANRASGKA